MPLCVVAVVDCDPSEPKSPPELKLRYHTNDHEKLWVSAASVNALRNVLTPCASETPSVFDQQEVSDVQPRTRRVSSTRMPILQRVVPTVNQHVVCAVGREAESLAAGHVFEGLGSIYDQLSSRLSEAQLAAASNAMDVAAANLWASWSTSGHAAVHKCQGVLGAAMMIAVAGLSTRKLLEVGIMETSKIMGMQVQELLAIFVAGRSESMFEIATYKQGKKLSLETLEAKGVACTGCSCCGEVAQLLSQLLVDRLQATGLVTVSSEDLKEKTNNELTQLVTKLMTSTCKRPEVVSVALALAVWTAYCHDSSDGNPLRGTCCEYLFSFNGWASDRIKEIHADENTSGITDMKPFSVRCAWCASPVLPVLTVWDLRTGEGQIEAK